MRTFVLFINETAVYKARGNYMSSLPQSEILPQNFTRKQNMWHWESFIRNVTGHSSGINILRDFLWKGWIILK
jgi:hypothetical protein